MRAASRYWGGRGALFDAGLHGLGPMQPHRASAGSHAPCECSTPHSRTVWAARRKAVRCAQRAHASKCGTRRAPHRTRAPGIPRGSGAWQVPRATVRCGCRSPGMRSKRTHRWVAEPSLSPSQRSPTVPPSLRASHNPSTSFLSPSALYITLPFSTPQHPPPPPTTTSPHPRPTVYPPPPPLLLSHHQTWPKRACPDPRLERQAPHVQHPPSYTQIRSEPAETRRVVEVQAVLAGAEAESVRGGALRVVATATQRSFAVDQPGHMPEEQGGVIRGKAGRWLFVLLAAATLVCARAVGALVCPVVLLHRGNARPYADSRASVW